MDEKLLFEDQCIRRWTLILGVPASASKVLTERRPEHPLLQLKSNSNCRYIKVLQIREQESLALKHCTSPSLQSSLKLLMLSECCYGHCNLNNKPQKYQEKENMNQTESVRKLQQLYCSLQNRVQVTQKHEFDKSLPVCHLPPSHCFWRCSSCAIDADLSG